MQYFSILKKRDFFPFFLTQFFSAFADNLFKTSLVFLATFDVAFKTNYSVGVVTALISAVFTLPFLIFAAPAGQIANHYENSWLARIFKRCEVFIIILAWVGLSQGSFWIMLLSLFLSSTQATFFGPIKYSLVPAYLDKKDHIAGNGLIESSTFFAILLGTLVGGLLPKEYLGVIMFMSSLLCLYSSEKMVKTDVELGIIMIKGAVPGSKGGWVTIKDAVKKDLPDNVIYPAALLASVKDIEEVVNVSPEEIEEKVASVGADDSENQLAVGTAPEGGKKDES